MSECSIKNFARYSEAALEILQKYAAVGCVCKINGEVWRQSESAGIDRLVQTRARVTNDHNAVFPYILPRKVSNQPHEDFVIDRGSGFYKC